MAITIYLKVKENLSLSQSSFCIQETIYLFDKWKHANTLTSSSVAKKSERKQGDQNH